MIPAARVQSAIELLDAIVEAARGNGPPADRILSDWFRAHRFAGSKDRRAIRELVYDAIRACGPVPQSGRAAMLRLAQRDTAIVSLFDGSQYGPQPMAEGEPVADGGTAPAWLEQRLAASGVSSEDASALLARAPLDLRVNRLKASRDSIRLPEPAEHIAAPDGLRLPAGTPVEQWDEYRLGLVEVQDGGSQLACEAVGAAPGETIVDLCAGAGGKTLSLAAAMGNSGRIAASDTDRGRLSKLAPRADRAGATIIETVLLNPGRELEMLEAWRGEADAVLVDAPCSGTGTWRRNPEARWRLSEAQLARLVTAQDRLLDIAAELVKPGGRLTFVTCSLLDEEGTDRMAAFAQRHSGWDIRLPQLPLGSPRGAGVRLSPWADGTDGFFIACAGRPC